MTKCLGCGSLSLDLRNCKLCGNASTTSNQHRWVERCNLYIYLSYYASFLNSGVQLQLDLVLFTMLLLVRGIYTYCCACRQESYGVVYKMIVWFLANWHNCNVRACVPFFTILFVQCLALHRCLSGDTVWLSRVCSEYSLQFSKREPHAASEEAKMNVEKLTRELTNSSVRGGIPSFLTLWEGVPKRSMAMLVCKVWLKEEHAVQHYPRRPPIPKDFNTNIMARNGRLALPAFLIHFS